jgi:hypothetical protein
MKLETLTEHPAGSLEPVHGRELKTAAYLLRHHGYDFLAREIDELAREILATRSSSNS